MADYSEYESEFCRQNGLPLPVESSSFRLRRLLSLRNRVNLYHSSCAASGRPLLTSIDPQSGIRVYHAEIWNSDTWDALEFGRPYDFSRPFFEQFAELVQRVPLPNLSIQYGSVENCDYCNGVLHCRNCYLVFGSVHSSDSLYGRDIVSSRNVIDCSGATECELCYSCREVQNCYNTAFADYCRDCTDCRFIEGCFGCRDCFGCVNLANRQYCYFNQQLDPKEYRRRIGQFDLGSRAVISDVQRLFAQFLLDHPLREYHGQSNENCSGNFITNSKNCRESYCITEGQDLDRCIWGSKSRSSVMLCHSFNSELTYCVQSSTDNYNLKFCSECWGGSRDLEYCLYCVSGSANCFGSVGLRRQSYCILNRNYSPSEYHDLVDRIKRQMIANGEYGRLFPPSITPHSYNRSEAMTYFPLSREQALAEGYRWCEDQAAAAADNAVSPPDNILAADDSILGEQIKCRSSGKPFKFNRTELEFHRRQSLALPDRAPLIRLADLTEMRQIQPLQQCSCSRCSRTMLTANSGKGRPLLCENCYRQAVF